MKYFSNKTTNDWKDDSYDGRDNNTGFHAEPCRKVPIPCNTPSSISFIDDYLIFPNDTSEETAILNGNEKEHIGANISDNIPYNSFTDDDFPDDTVIFAPKVNETLLQNNTGKDDTLYNQFTTEIIFSDLYNNTDEMIYFSPTNRTSPATFTFSNVTETYMDFNVTNDSAIYFNNTNNNETIQREPLNNKLPISFENFYDENNWIDESNENFNRTKRQHDYDHHYSGSSYSSINSYNDFREPPTTVSPTPETTSVREFKHSTQPIHLIKFSSTENTKLLSEAHENRTFMTPTEVLDLENFTSTKTSGISEAMFEETNKLLTTPTQLDNYECYAIICDKGEYHFCEYYCTPELYLIVFL